MAEKCVVNHIGLCVTDLDRSRRFYTELLDFEETGVLDAPDEATSRLLRIEPPVNLRAVYLTRDGFVLELLHYDRPENPPARERPFNEPGLTHLSVSVDDIDEVCGRVESLGGRTMPETHVGLAVTIRDPDGQVIELLPSNWREQYGA
jgi:catechol 2,3-dioxygenase-like lactoylglutathione lyase family enzyme